MRQYYSVPFSFADLLGRKPREVYSCTLQESIQQNISLIIGTKLQECRYDFEYGCAVWEADFVVPSNINIWKEEIKATLETAILRYEERIDAIRQFTLKVEGDKQMGRRNHQVVQFYIQGSIKGTGQQFQFSDNLYFSPYSR